MPANVTHRGLAEQIDQVVDGHSNDVLSDPRMQRHVMKRAGSGPGQVPWGLIQSAGEIIVGTLFEPVDWLLTAREVYNDPTNVVSYIGFLPGVPASTSKLLKGMVKHVDDVNYNHARVVEELFEASDNNIDGSIIRAAEPQAVAPRVPFRELGGAHLSSSADAPPNQAFSMLRRTTWKQVTERYRRSAMFQPTA